MTYATRVAPVLALAFVLAGVPAAHPTVHAAGDGSPAAPRYEPGHRGGRLVVALRAEPRTLNPAIAADAPSREIISAMTADLLHADRVTRVVEPSLASSWTRSADGRSYTLRLRTGVRFSDGQPFDADDVVFTFRALLDERVAAPQRDLLIVGGKPVSVAKIDSHAIRVTLAEPYAAAERLFDSLAILPEHLLARSFKDGTLGAAWAVTTAPQAIAGLGPFRLKQYVPGQQLILERNPYYWKKDTAGRTLPYLDEVVFLFSGNEDAQVIRFQSGESDVVSRLSPENFAVLSRDAAAGRVQLRDLGPSLEYNFLFFNQNDLRGRDLPHVSAKQRWFSDARFRHAVSLAIDREGIARLVYRGRAMPLWGHVSPGNRRWVNGAIPRPARSTAQARTLLRGAGFQFRPDGALVDRDGRRVEFTIVTSSSNAQRTEMATLIQADLEDIGIEVRVVPLEFRALLDRVFQSFDYEASVLGLGGGDGDPNSEMNVWLSRGANHLWRIGQAAPATAWEGEIDRLMQQQLVAPSQAARKRLYDRVQQIVAEQQPLIFLATPHVLVGARANLGNFRPTVLDHPLWNVEHLFLSGSRGVATR